MPKFLILQSPNKGNVGTTTERSEDFYKPTFYKITDEELETFTAMNAHAKAAYIAEKLEAQMGTPLQDKKKVAPIVEIAESQAGKESVETFVEKNYIMPETEIDEPLNEPVNELEQIAEIANEIINESIETIIEVPKAKGRPKKTN